MEVVVVALRTRIGAVEADDAEILIFDPDTSEEAATTGIFLRRQIEHEAAHVAEELAARVVEVIVLAVKVVAVGEDHPGKAQGLILEFELLGKAAEKALLHAFVFIFGGFAFAVFVEIVATVDGITEVHAAEEVMIVLRNRAQSRILGQILEIGFDHGSPRRQELNQVLLAQDHAVDNLVHRGWRRQIRRSLT